MKNKKIDLSDIKEKSLEETTTFTDLMSRREKRKRKKEEMLDDIEDMIQEKRKNTQDLTNDINKIKVENISDKKRKKDIIDKTKEIYIKDLDNEKEENLTNTQIIDLTKKMKFNFDDVKEENTEKKKNGVSLLNVIGIINLICIGFYIYLLAFTSYQDNESNYMIAGGFIISLVFFFGLSLVCSKKLRKIFNIINILAILLFIAFNIYTFMK